VSRAELRLVDVAANAVDEFLPDWDGLEVSTTRAGDGVLTFAYPPDGMNADLLVPSAVVAVTINGQEPKNCRFLYRETSGNRVTQDQELVVYTMRNVVDGLDEAGFRAPDVGTTTPQTRTWTNRSPGTIASEVVVDAAGRGCFDWWGYSGISFTTTADSEGAAWPQLVTVELSYADKQVLDVWKWLRDNGYVEWGSSGSTLDLFSKFTRGTDRTAGSNPLMMYVGRDISDAPFDTSMDAYVTHVTVIGDHPTVDGDVQYLYLNSSTTPWGRRERSVRVSGVKSTTVLGQIAGQYLQAFAEEQESRSYAMVDDIHQPFLDFVVGDTIRVVTDRVRDERVQSIQGRWSAANNVSYIVTCGDYINDRDDRVEQRINRLAGN
jgi:hypothetical protein